MSVVLSYVDTTKAIIASDGLATYKNKRTAHSNEQKIIHLNDNVLLGYAGHLHSCLRIVSLLTNAKPENQPIVNAMLVEDTNTFIQKCIASFDNLERCGFLICGKGKNGVPCSASTSNYAPDVLNYAIADTILYYALYPEEVPRNVDLFRNRILQCPHDIRFAMGLTIDDVAKLSPTVNTQHYFQELRF